MSDDEILRRVAWMIEAARKESGARRVRDAIAALLSADQTTRDASAAPEDKSRARKKRSECLAAAYGVSMRGLARMDLLAAIDNAARLRELINAHVSDECVPDARTEYEYELVQELRDVLQADEHNYAQWEDSRGGSPYVPIEWPNSLKRARDNPARVALDDFTREWPEHAAHLLEEDVLRVVEAWGRRGRPNASSANERKWSLAAQVIDKAGLGVVEPRTLKSAWSRRGSADEHDTFKDDEPSGEI